MFGYCQFQPGMANWPVPPVGRMMVFLDGENLTLRYQDMKEEGRTPTQDISHENNTYVWTSNTVINPEWNQIVRATYYTYCIGDDQKVARIARENSELKFGQLSNPFISGLPERLGNKFRAKVFKKPKAGKAKGVDIQITVDMLSNAFSNNLDVAFLVSGDGDYVPVLEEVIRHGKKVHVAALSSGLHPKLKDIADKFYDLDGSFFLAMTP